MAWVIILLNPVGVLRTYDLPPVIYSEWIISNSFVWWRQAKSFKWYCLLKKVLFAVMVLYSIYIQLFTVSLEQHSFSLISKTCSNHSSGSFPPQSAFWREFSHKVNNLTPSEFSSWSALRGWERRSGTLLPILLRPIFRRSRVSCRV